MTPRRLSNVPSQSPSQPREGDGDGSPREAAAFVASVLLDLKQVAQRHRLDTLTYLLELAYLEAQGGLKPRQKIPDV